MSTFENEENTSTNQLKQQKVDKMLREYDYNKQNQQKLEQKNDHLGLSLPKISYSKNWANNEHLDRFLKCMSPAFAIIGVGGLFWGAGFAVNEISKAASFLKDVSLPESFTNIIATTAFWEVVGVVAAVCATVFIIATIYSSVKKMKANSLQQAKIQNHQMSEPEISHQISQNYMYNINKNIGNSENIIDKNRYNTKLNTSNFPNEMQKKIQQHTISTNKDDRNKQEISGKNKQYFNIDEKNSYLSKKYDINNYSQSPVAEKNI